MKESRASEREREKVDDNRMPFFVNTRIAANPFNYISTRLITASAFF